MTRQRKLTGLLMILLVAVLVLSGSVFAAAKKEGLVKVKSNADVAAAKKDYEKRGMPFDSVYKGVLYNKGKKVKVAYDYYFYEGGKRVKNTWKTIKTGSKTNKYYFGSNGKAYRAFYSILDSYEGRLYVKKKIGAKYYAFDVNGHMLTGMFVNRNSQIEFYGVKGVFNAKKTATLRKMFKKIKGKVYKGKTDTVKQIRKVFGKELKFVKAIDCCNGNAGWDTEICKDVHMYYDNMDVQLVYNTKTRQYYVYDAFSLAYSK